VGFLLWSGHQKVTVLRGDHHAAAILAGTVEDVGREVAAGRIKTLGKDEHVATRKHPPREIEAWHALDRQSKPKGLLFSGIIDKYLDYLTNSRTRKSAREHLGRFGLFISRAMKVSALRVHHVTHFLETKVRSWCVRLSPQDLADPPPPTV
jgi:hypothetical protein